MRIISGKYRGQKLLTFESDVIRPYTDRIKESVFSSLQFQLPGSRVLDLYAGSGSIGFEALSRGAEFVSFNDISFKAVSLLKKNAEKLKIDEKFYNISQQNSLAYLQYNNLDFNLVFIDPPFALSDWQELLSGLLNADWNKSPLIIARHESVLEVKIPEGFTVKKNKKIGKSILNYLEIK